MRHYLDDAAKVELLPCYGCETGWGGYSGGRDEKGEFVEINTCHKSCQRLANYTEQQYKKFERSGLKVF